MRGVLTVKLKPRVGLFPSEEISLENNGTTNVNFSLESPETDDDVFTASISDTRSATKQYVINSAIYHSSMKKLKPIEELDSSLSLDNAAESHHSEYKQAKHRGDSKMTKCSSDGVRKIGKCMKCSAKEVKSLGKAVKFISPKNSSSSMHKQKDVYTLSNKKV